MSKRLCVIALGALLAFWAGPGFSPSGALAAPFAQAATFLPDQASSLPAAMSGAGLEERAGSGTAASPVDALAGGGLLGALLFGSPYEGLNSVDFLVMILIGLTLYRRFALRPKKDDRRFTLHSREDGTPGSPMPGGDGRTVSSRESGADAGADPAASAKTGDPRDNPWSRRLGAALKSPPDSPWLKAARRAADRPAASDRAGEVGGGAFEAELSAATADLRLPQDFDAEAFIAGALTLYERLQEAWAGRDLSGLQDFVSPELFAVLQKRAHEMPAPLRLAITELKAELRDLVRRAGDEEEARVVFEALISSDGAEPAPVREEWRFWRGRASAGMWRLTGIGEA